MKNLFNYLNKHGVFVILPFFTYLVFIIFQREFNEFERYFFGFFFFFTLLLSNFYFIIFHTEKIHQHSENSQGRFKFLAHTLGIVFFLSLTFASYYWCLFDYNNENFINVKNTNHFLEFLYYSFGIFIMNNSSEIEANSLYAKLFVGTEMLTAFITLILILANFKDLKTKKRNIN